MTMKFHTSDPHMAVRCVCESCLKSVEPLVPGQIGFAGTLLMAGWTAFGEHKSDRVFWWCPLCSDARKNGRAEL